MAQNTNYFSNNSKTINEKSEVEKVQLKYDLESKAYPINQSMVCDLNTSQFRRHTKPRAFGHTTY